MFWIKNKLTTTFSTSKTLFSSTIAILRYFTGAAFRTFHSLSVKQLSLLFSNAEKINQIDSEITDTIRAKLKQIETQSIEAIRNIKIELNDTVRSKTKSQKPIYKSFILKHKVEDSNQDFSYTSESSGTLQFFSLLYRVMLALKKGGVFIFDEIEIKLHQNLVAYIIGLFQNKYENPHGAQLIFSFHNTYFMDILEPSQLWFTEKNDRGYTEIFSAADFKDIKKLQQRSLEELYRLGRFGAKPRGI